MSRIIATGLVGNKANEILNGVIGQMSDGMYENIRYYEKYWMFVEIDENNNIVVDDADHEFHYGYNRYTPNGFYHLSDNQVKAFFAKKIEDICKEELRDNGIPVRGKFKANCPIETKYLNYYETITMGDCWNVYNILLEGGGD